MNSKFYRKRKRVNQVAKKEKIRIAEAWMLDDIVGEIATILGPFSKAKKIKILKCVQIMLEPE